MFQESTRESGEHSQNLWWQNTEMGTDRPQNAKDCVRKCEFGEHYQNSSNQQWCELSEVVESDFLISPGDVYPNRKVELEDTDIKDSTRVSFEVLCEQQHEAFSKNNEDIGHTQLIEMEIDTGDSLPVTIHFTVKTLRLGTSGNRNFGKIWCDREEFVEMGITSDSCS